MPAFFGFEADPAFVAETSEGFEAIEEREIALAQKFWDAFFFGADGIFEMDVADVAA